MAKTAVRSQENSPRIKASRGPHAASSISTGQLPLLTLPHLFKIQDLELAASAACAKTFKSQKYTFQNMLEMQAADAASNGG